MLGRDQNLLFGLLALQLQFIRPEEFLDAAAAWSVDPTKSLADRLVDAGVLETGERVLIDGLVEDALEQHGGDEVRTFQAFGGETVLAEHVSRVRPDRPSVAAATKLGIPLGVSDVAEFEPSAVPETPGRYTRKSEYSRGGMGRILLVYDEYLSRDIALKELIPPKDDSYPTTDKGSPVRAVSSLAVRFLREAKVTGQLEHPSIVPVYELGRRPNGTLYYTMKLVRGQTLARALRNVATLEERLTFLSHYVDLCQALGYAHSRNVIHRDIKPSNVMIGEFGETVVIDWGLAKVLGQTDIHEAELRKTWHMLRGASSGEDPAKTMHGLRLGTPQYMAPEQAEGKVDEVDQRTDVFALGTVLYEILTGSLPFDSDSTEAVFHQVIACTPQPVNRLEESAPPELVSICQRAMQRDPEARYQSAKELADDVQRFLTGAVVHAYEYSPKEVLTRFYRRHRPLITATSSAILLVILFGVLSYINIRTARNEALLARDSEAAARRAESDARENAEQNAYDSQIRLAQQYLNNRDFDLASDTLWGTQSNRRNWAWGFLMNRLGQDLYTIPGFVSAAMSPDGRRIAAISTSHPITIFDSANGSVLVEFDPLTRRLTNEVEFSPDGRYLAGACLDRRVRVFDSRDGNLLLTLRGHGGTLNAVSYDASGERIVSAGGKTARVWNASTGDAISVFPGHCDAQPDCSVWRAGFVPNSNLAFSHGGDGFARIWDAASGDEMLAVEGGSPAIDPSGKLLAVSSGLSLQVWDIQSGTRQCETTGHRAFLGRIAFSPSGDEVFSTSEDGTIRGWDPSNGAEIRRFVHPGKFHRLTFSSDGRLLAAINGDGLIKIWDLTTDKEVRSIQSQNSLAYALAFFAGDTRLMTAARESQVMAWGVQRSIGQSPVAAFERGIQTFTVSNDNSRIGVVDGDNTASIVRMEDGAVEAVLTSFDSRANSAIAVSPSGRYVVAATDPCVPFLADRENLSEVQALEGHEGPVRHLAYSPDGRFIVSSSWDQTARLWDGRSGAFIQAFTGHSGSLSRAAFRPDSNQLLTASRDGTVRIWDVETGSELRVLDAHAGGVLDADWAPDGTRFATSGEDEQLRVWDAETGEPNLTIAAGRATNLVRFSADGDLLFTNTYGSGTVVWRSDTGSPLVQQSAFAPFAPYQLEPTRQGRGLLVAMRDQTAVWKLEAAPWTDPGNTDDAWRRRYEQYRAEQRNADTGRNTISELIDTPMVIVTNVEALRARMERFRDVLASETEPSTHPQADEGIVITGNWSNALARLCLLDGDVIIALDGKPIRDRSAAVSALDAWAARNLDHLELTLSRGNLRYDVQIVTVPLRQQERTLTLDRSDAIAIINGLLNARGGSLDSAGQLSQEFVARAGEQLASPGVLYGFPFSLSDAPPLKAYALQLGLAMGDWVMAVDGVPVRDVEELMDQLAAIIESLEGGNEHDLTVDVERGEFIRLRNIIQIR